MSRADTYTPGARSSRPRSRSPPAFRRRSRSPRRDDDRWRASRPRSPPRRGYSPRRDDYRNDRARSPPRREYDSYTRSPRRDRSPPPRERDPSPARSRAARSDRYDEPRSRAHRYCQRETRQAALRLLIAVLPADIRLPAKLETTAAGHRRPDESVRIRIPQTHGDVGHHLQLETHLYPTMLRAGNLPLPHDGRLLRRFIPAGLR